MRVEASSGSGGGGTIAPTVVVSDYATSSKTITSTLDASKTYIFEITRNNAPASSSTSGTDVYLIQNNALTEIRKDSASIFTVAISSNTLSVTLSQGLWTSYTLLQL